MNKLERWWIALAGILLQMVLGAVYAWSVFRIPLSKQFHWSISEVTLAFTICILIVGFASFLGGVWMRKSGPRVVALTGAVLYGLGIFLASFSYLGLNWLYLSYGVIGGLGLGLGYIVPIAVLVKWFPDKRGIMTGVAVGGFGAGALLTAPVATHLIQTVGVLKTFADLGLVYLVVAVIAASFMKNPPAGWAPEGWTPSPKSVADRVGRDFTFAEAMKTWQWYALWMLLFLDASAGISLISQEAPIFIDLGKVTAIVAAGMVGVVSIGNALGRIFWSSVSDLISRRLTFTVMFLVQVGLFFVLPSLHSAGIITVVAFVMLMCYGGGFGTMPAFAADYFGPTNVGSIYGLMLTAWGAASAFGPLLIAHLRQSTGNYTSGLHAIALVMLISVLLPLLVKPPKAA